MTRDFVLFHRLDDPVSASIRREVVDRGLKPRVDFQNIDSDEGRELFALRGGTTIPAVWDGSRMLVGQETIRAWLAGLAGERR